MQSEYAFNATYDQPHSSGPQLTSGREQAYKKRFARWGFCKNTKRQKPTQSSYSSSTSPEDSHEGDTASCYCEKDQSSLAIPPLSPREELILEILVTIRSWSGSFFDSRKSGMVLTAVDEARLPWGDSPLADRAKAVSASFKLALELLDRGQGESAGRVARKAFLLVEDMLELNAPALVWNVLELMFEMLSKGHSKLFQMLLDHLWNLVRQEKSPSHPISTLLRGLRKLVAISMRQGRIPESRSLYDSQLECDFISATLEQAWTVNAEIVFETFGLHQFDIYTYMSWDSCAISPPDGIKRAAKPWLEKTFKSETSGALWRITNFDPSTSSDRPAWLRGSSEAGSGEAPRFINRHQFEEVMFQMRSRGALILQNGNDDYIVLLRILAGLVTADVVGPFMEHLDVEEMTDDVLSTSPSLSAGMAACTIRLMMDLDESSEDEEGLHKAAEQLRQLVWLRSYAYGNTHPKVLSEMLLLEDALIAANEAENAEELRRHMLHQLETFVADIPTGSA